MGYVVDWNSAAIIFATLAGPILAVQAQRWVDRRRSLSDRQFQIFRTLMATRSSMISHEHVGALNAVPVEFYGTKGKLKKINDAWKLYYDHHNVSWPASEIWMQKRFDIFQDLLFVISQYLGYDFSLAQLKEIYSPIAHGTLESEQTIIRQGLAKLFSGETVLPMAVKEFPATADDATLASQAALQKLLMEWLAGERAVSVETTSDSAKK